MKELNCTCISKEKSGYPNDWQYNHLCGNTKCICETVENQWGTKSCLSGLVELPVDQFSKGLHYMWYFKMH